MDTDALKDKLRTAGALLVEQRQSKVGSQADLAEKAGVNERTIRRIEGGKAAELASYAAIAGALGLPLHWFLIADELLDPARRAMASDAAMERALESLVAAGDIRPSAVAFLRACVAFAREQGGTDQAPATGRPQSCADASSSARAHRR